ncbi:unnamed protein product [Lepeophtheirus salmonis]|uniref:(salmon louse) hypothetical protein n=1 Tax=Lepeophtheirus salmonis TaxID=72036 RepID=A0A7R8D401_LEPSM|nr:unnamed protein product [Lepeophtheirus salmonis]CAF2969644.1 unnamed protein product [Lepeophtheirus salmonis]
MDKLELVDIYFPLACVLWICELRMTLRIASHSLIIILKDSFYRWINSKNASSISTYTYIVSSSDEKRGLCVYIYARKINISENIVSAPEKGGLLLTCFIFSTGDCIASLPESTLCYRVEGIQPIILVGLVTLSPHPATLTQSLEQLELHHFESPHISFPPDRRRRHRFNSLHSEPSSYNDNDLDLDLIYLETLEEDYKRALNRFLIKSYLKQPSYQQLPQRVTKTSAFDVGPKSPRNASITLCSPCVNSANGGNASSSGSHHGSSHHHHLSLSNSSSSHGSQHHGNNSGNAGGSVNCMSHSNSPNTGSPPNGLPGLPGSAPINMWPLIWNHITK